MSRSRVEKVGRSDRVGWDDVPKDELHLHCLLGKNLRLLSTLNPSAQLRYSPSPHGDGGAWACVLSTGLKIGGHVRVIRANQWGIPGAATDTSGSNSTPSIVPAHKVIGADNEPTT